MTKAVDDEAAIEASRAPLLDHLMELRDRIVRAVIAIGIGFGVGFYFADEIYRILQEPYFVSWAKVFGPDVPAEKFIITGPLEWFFAQMRVALFAGICLAFPYIAHEVYGFVAPGLYRREKLAIAPYLVVAPLLFAFGMAIAFFFVMPALQDFALGQLRDQGLQTVEAAFRVADYLSLTTTLLLAFGVSFQMPLILTLCGQVGIVSAATLRKFRKYAIVIMAVFAAIVTPADPFSMLFMLLPLLGLYEISVLLVAGMEKRRLKEAGETAHHPAE